jgi:hypothetical protein
MEIGMSKLRKKWIIGLGLGVIALGLVVSGVTIWIKCSAMPDEIQVERKLTAADSIFFDSVKKAKPTFNKIIDSTLHIKIDLYRVLNYKGDTTIWRTSDCEIKKKTFECYHQSCWGLGCSGFRTRIGGRIAKIHYKDTIYDTTHRNLNFGKNALIKYIPVAKIPKIDRRQMKKRLSKLSGKACSEIANLKSNYTFEAIGLPEGFTWKVDSKEFNKGPYDTGPYEAYIKQDGSFRKKCVVSEVKWKMFKHPNDIFCRCSAISLPEQKETFYSRLFNGSLQAYKDTTISWKLVYKDQYGRGDTLDITTKFE